MTTLQDILTAAQGLPSAERAQLIYALWDSISPDEWTQPSDTWVDEARRRSKALDNGQMTTAPWSKVRERGRRQAGLDD
ncbi:MAG: addiction module protein [Chloroflexi bacterium]|nr:addiction module protein [Chloroflexota bacterium]